VWIKSRLNFEFVTCSTDGKLLFWEMQNYNLTGIISKENPPVIIRDKPLFLVDKDGETEKEFGATIIEYNSESGVSVYY
jgi:hypothetical protein